MVLSLATKTLKEHTFDFFCYHLQLRQTRPERKNKNKVCSQTLWLAISLHLNHAVEDQTFWPLLWGKTAQTREAELKGGIDQQQLQKFLNNFMVQRLVV